MKAFVKTNNGTFPNVNFFLAWEAFNTMGYSVTLFEEKDIDNLDITVSTPVFAGITIFRRIIDKLGVNYPPFDCYPEVLKPYYGRNIHKSTLGEERFKYNKNPIPIFVKPVLPKQFIGNVWNSILNLIPLANVPDIAEVWVCEPINILSEFRVYVHDGDILGVKNYYGKWDIVPDRLFVKEVVKNYRPSPIAYGVDIGVTDGGKCFVIEANDGCNLGNYGLDSIHYGEMIVDRWFEIVATPKVEKQMVEDINFADECEKKYDWAKDNGNKVREFYSDSWARGGKTGKDVRISNEVSKMKQDALKAFANEVRQRLSEEKA